MADVIKRVFSVEVIDINEDGTPKLTKNKEFKFVTKEFAVRLPSYKVMEEANKLKGKVFRESLNDGDMLRDQLEDILRQKGLWNDQRQIEYDTLRKEILDREYQLEKGGIKLSDAKYLALEMKEKRERMVEMLSGRSDLDSQTCEGKSENARFNYLFAHSLVYNDDELTPFYPNGLEDYVVDMDNPIAIKGATEFYYLLSGTENLDDKLPENKFLKRFNFVDDKYRLVEKDSSRLVDADGRYIDEYGNYIQYNEDGTYYYVDVNGRKLDEQTGNFIVDEPAPFLDDYGNPISTPEQETTVNTKTKTTRKRKTTKKAETVETVDADA
jgi:predicted nucleic acid-binding protein